MKRTFSLSLVVLAAVCLFRASQLLNTAHAQDEQGRHVEHRVNPESLPDNSNAPETSRGNRPGVGDALTTGGTGVVTPAITWHGGPVIATPTIYLIWYGNWNQANGSDTPAGQQIVRDFAGSIGGSPYFLLNTTYSAGGYNITGLYRTEKVRNTNDEETPQIMEIRVEEPTKATHVRLDYNSRTIFDAIKKLDVFPHNLSTSSPLVVGDLIFLVTSNGVDEGHINIPQPKAPSWDNCSAVSTPSATTVMPRFWASATMALTSSEPLFSTPIRLTNERSTLTVLAWSRWR